jgi:hypothetical protein
VIIIERCGDCGEIVVGDGFKSRHFYAFEATVLCAEMIREGGVGELSARLLDLLVVEKIPADA